ncbi:PadR family transcriptional regulator [Desulfosporosinus shakirovi]|uniref:PadR family transcriptional regulator n=1 Tax=Desulfosporosinus shakirovi TaxID=2885154 RepID=UPI0037C02BFD|nr:helix-turn-helix transcriptional regulator [Desulfosporosinus sp. SRJS8]
MNATGYTQIAERKSLNGPARKYYRLTPTGLEYLDQMLAEWGEILHSVSALGIRI